jgi:hypothetical protein
MRLLTTIKVQTAQLMREHLRSRKDHLLRKESPPANLLTEIRLLEEEASHRLATFQKVQVPKEGFNLPQKLKLTKIRKIHLLRKPPSRVTIPPKPPKLLSSNQRFTREIFHNHQCLRNRKARVAAEADQPLRARIGLLLARKESYLLL